MKPENIDDLANVVDDDLADIATFDRPIPTLSQGFMKALRLGGAGIEQALGMDVDPAWIKQAREDVQSATEGSVPAKLFSQVLEALPSTAATLPLSMAGGATWPTLAKYGTKALSILGPIKGAATGAVATGLTNKNADFDDYTRNMLIGGLLGMYIPITGGAFARSGLEGAMSGALMPHESTDEQLQNTAIAGGAGGLMGAAGKAVGSTWDFGKSIFDKDYNALKLAEYIASLKAGEGATGQQVRDWAMKTARDTSRGILGQSAEVAPQLRELGDMWHPSSFYTNDPVDRAATAYARNIGGHTFSGLNDENIAHVDNYLLNTPSHYNAGETAQSFYDKFLGREGVSPKAHEDVLRNYEGTMDADALTGYFRQRANDQMSYPPYAALANRVAKLNENILAKADAAKQVLYSSDPKVAATFTPAMQSAIDRALKLENPKHWDWQAQWIEDALRKEGAKASLGGQDRKLIDEYITDATRPSPNAESAWSKIKDQHRLLAEKHQQLQNMEDITTKYVGSASIPREELPTAKSLTNTLLKYEPATEFGTAQLDPAAMQDYLTLIQILRQHERSMPPALHDKELEFSPLFNSVARMAGSALGNELGWTLSRGAQLLGTKNTNRNLVRFMTEPATYANYMYRVAKPPVAGEWSKLAARFPALFGNLSAQWSQ